MTTLIPKVDFKNGGSTPTGAINRFINEKLSESLSVLDFGADSTGVSDSTTAIQNAINAAISLKKSVYVPGGTYLISSTLTIANCAGFKMFGDGINTSTIKTTTNFTSLITLGGTANYCFFSSFSLLTTGSTTQCVIAQENATVIKFDNVEFHGDLNGDLVYSNGQNLDFNGCSWYVGSSNTWGANLDSYNQNCGFIGCRLGGLGNGFRTTNAYSSSNPVEGLRIDSCYFINIGGTNVRVGASNLTAISNSVLDQATTANLIIDAGANDVMVSNSWLGIRYLLDGTATITSSSTTATVTMSVPTGLTTGQVVNIIGASPSAYNGVYTITVTGANTFTYTFAGGTSPATGTITVRRPGSSVLINPGANSISIMNCTIEGGDKGISAAASTTQQVTGLNIIGNIFQAAFSASIGLDTVASCNIVGNTDYTSGSTSWYTSKTATSGIGGDYRFSNNRWTGTSPALFDTTASYRFGYDTNIVGNNYGQYQFPTSSTSQVISHGLFTTPKNVTIVAEGYNNIAYVTAVGPTSFTVNLATSYNPLIRWSATV
jgi:hypothetical protein